MKLLIISDLPHYKQNGQIVGWGTTVREINQLSKIFSEIRFIASFHPGPAPKSSLPYTSERIKLIPVPPSGGPRLVNKLKILRYAPLYCETILKQLPWADLVHVRCPNNLGLLAVLLLALVSRPKMRWVKYAGTWGPSLPQPWSYDLQRWWLAKGFHRGVVTVNGEWHGQPPHIYSFLNPSLTDQEVMQAREAGINKKISTPISLLYVGRVETAKGAGRAIEIARILKEQGIEFYLHIVGDGPEMSVFEQMASDYKIRSRVWFHGWISKLNVLKFYAQAHFLLLPSMASEGWPNVISEALAHGVVPLASTVSQIPQTLKEISAGMTFTPQDVNAFTRAVIDYVNDPDRWKRESLAGMAAADKFTYTTYLQRLQKMFRKVWGTDLARVPA